MGLYARDRLRSSSERAASCAVGSSTAVAGWAYPASLAPKNAGGINSPTAGASRAHTTAPICGLRVMSFDREQLRLPLSSAAKRSRFCHHVDPRAEPGVCPRCLRLRSADGLKLSTRCTRPCASTAHSARTNRPAPCRPALLWRASRSIPITLEVEYPPPLGSRFVRLLIRSNTSGRVTEWRLRAARERRTTGPACCRLASYGVASGGARCCPRGWPSHGRGRSLS